MAVIAFQDLSLADRDREWDGDAAEGRVRTWAKADDEPNETYRNCFGVDVPTKDVDRIKSHLATYYAKMDETAPWER